MKEEHMILTRFLTKKLTLKEYINLSKKIIDSLKEVHDIFSNLYSWGKTIDAWSEIDTNSDDFKKIVFDHVKDEKIRYENSGSENTEMTYESKCFRGYRNSYSNTNKDENERVTITIDAGGRNGIGMLNIVFPKKKFDELKNIDTIKILFSKVIQLLNPEFISYTSNEFMRQFANKKYKFHLGYINYLKNKKASNFLPENSGIEFFNDGLLFGIMNDFSLDFSAIDSNEISIIQERLGSIGFLNYTPKING